MQGLARWVAVGVLALAVACAGGRRRRVDRHLVAVLVGELDALARGCLAEPGGPACAEAGRVRARLPRATRCEPGDRPCHKLRLALPPGVALAVDVVAGDGPAATCRARPFGATCRVTLRRGFVWLRATRPVTWTGVPACVRPDGTVRRPDDAGGPIVADACGLALTGGARVRVHPVD